MTLRGHPGTKRTEEYIISIAIFRSHQAFHPLNSTPISSHTMALSMKTSSSAMVGRKAVAAPRASVRAAAKSG